MKKPPLIYLSGPLTCGQVTRNVSNALATGKQLMDLGYVVIIPHEKILTEIMYPMSYREWMDYDLRIIRCCDAVFRMEGLSPGANEEVRFAESLGIPVYWTLDLLLLELPPIDWLAKEKGWIE
jgi:hypothetical protein